MDNYEQQNPYYNTPTEVYQAPQVTTKTTNANAQQTTTGRNQATPTAATTPNQRTTTGAASTLSTAVQSTTIPSQSSTTLPTLDSPPTPLTNQPVSAPGIADGGFSQTTENTARWVGLGIFGMLALTGIIIIGSWAIRRYRYFRKNKQLEANDPFPFQQPTIPEVKPEKTANDDYYAPTQDEPRPPPYMPHVPVLTGHGAQFSRLPVAPQAFRPRRNTAGSVAPLRPHRRPPPLELSDISKSNAPSMKSGRSMFYAQSGHSQSSLGSDPFQDGHAQQYATYPPSPHSPHSPHRPSTQHTQHTPSTSQYSYIPPMSPLSPLHPPSPSQMGEQFPRF